MSPLSPPPAQDNHLFNGFALMLLGLLILSGVEIFGSALLESSPWKQHILYTLLLIYGMLPSDLQRSKVAWASMAGLFLFFLVGGANLYASVSLVFSVQKILLLALVIYQGVSLWQVRGRYGTWPMLFPLISLVLVGLILPIKDRNLLESVWAKVSNFSGHSWSDDSYFHYYLGGLSCVVGFVRLLLSRRGS